MAAAGCGRFGSQARDRPEFDHVNMIRMFAPQGEEVYGSTWAGVASERFGNGVQLPPLTYFTGVNTSERFIYYDVCDSVPRHLSSRSIACYLNAAELYSDHRRDMPSGRRTLGLLTYTVSALA